MATGGDWRRDVLGLIGAPATATNLSALSLWAQSEGLPDWYHNWLATFRKTPGWGPARTGFSPPYYASTNQGAMATAMTIAQSNMAPIRRALQAGTTLGNIWAAVNQSPWCGGCQTGHYPIVLEQAIGSGAAGPPGVPPLTIQEVGFGLTSTTTKIGWAFANLAAWVNTYSVQEYNAILSVAQALERV